MQRLSTTNALILLLSLIASAPLMADFTGSESCKDCHASQHDAWQGSHHELAMQHANPQSVLGDFADSEFSHKGVTSKFFIKDGQYFINTDDHEGVMRDFRISYAFGVDPLQQYLVEFPDGRIQALSIAWDSRPASGGGQRWFHLYPDETFTSNDSMHWTGYQQNWNYMCADCHTTNLKKGYSESKNTFSTSWSAINVSCESCHGPASDHLAWSAKEDSLKLNDVTKGLAFLLDEKEGVSWTTDPESGNPRRSSVNDHRKEISVCASCHSRRGSLKPAPEADTNFMDHHLPALLTDGLYHADGQIEDEVYVWGSFRQSKMFAAGVTCSDCHNPHSLELRAEGPLVCAQCHQPAKYASTEHHNHPLESTGANCLDCHMPQSTYMQVDPRRDHSIRIPRPDLSLEFNTPNACTQCHDDKPDEWAATHFTHWYPEIGPSFQHWTNALNKARNADLTAELSLLRVVSMTETPDIARATALQELQNYLSPLSGPVAQQSLNDENPLIRLAALRALQQVPMQNLYPIASHLLQDPVLAVRAEAGRLLSAMSGQGLPPGEQAILDKAIQDYVKTQKLHADRVESQMNLGNLYMTMGNAIESENRYRKALKLDPGFVPVYINLSDLYRSQGLNPQATKVLKDAVAKLPDAAALHHALGLALVRQGNNTAAMSSLRKANELEPQTVRYGYVLGVALNSIGDPAGAIEVLGNTHQQHPQERDVIFALSTIHRDQGRRTEAIHWAEKLLQLNPGDNAANQLLESLQ